MSRVTSSRSLTLANNQSVQAAKGTSRARTLTDFSIETLIGSPDCSPGRTSNDLYCRGCEEHPNVTMQASTRSQEPKTTTTTTTSDMKAQTNAHSVKKYRPKNFQCPACKMAFSNNGQLKNHVRIHTGERPFTCNYIDCNKTFTRNEELTRHKLIHTGVRPHICTCCGKRFGRKDHLKKHIRTHERKKLRKKVFVPMNRMRSIMERDSSKVDDEKMPNNNNMEQRHSPPTPQVEHLITKDHSEIKQVPTSDTLVLQTAANSIIPIAPLPYQLHPNICVPASTTTTTTTTASSFIAQPAPIFQPPSSSMIRSLTPTTANTIQQIASDYWQKWYNFMGLYQHQQQTCTNLTRDMFRR